MYFDKDIYNRITPPEVILCKASGERIGVLNLIQLTLDEKLNEPNELNFTVMLYQDEARCPYYEYIQEMMYIEIPGDSRYVISTVNISSEGSRNEKKTVLAKSYEWMLSTRFLQDFYINTGEVESIDGVNFRTLLSLCIDELFPEWMIGTIPANIATMQRSFEVSRTSVYDFLMTEVSEAFEVIFIFNSYAKTINVQAKSSFGVDSGVMVSYENLLKTTTMDLNVDEIKTALRVTGADDMDIREVNRSFDTIYNFSYYNSLDYMSESLYNAYNAWQRLTYNTPVDWNVVRNLKDSNGQPYFVFDNTKDLDGQYVMNFATIQSQYSTFLSQKGLANNYNNLYAFLLNKYQSYFTTLSEWSSTKIPAGNNARYFGYGTYPSDYPTNKSKSTFTIDKYTSVIVGSSLPSTGNSAVLYLRSDGSYGMYRYYNGRWINTNLWDNIAFSPLNEKLKSAENNQAVAMKKGYGSTLPPDGANATQAQKEAQIKNYNTYYLPYYYSIVKLKQYINTCQTNVNNYTSYQNRYSRAMQGISNLTSMIKNFTTAQLKELYTFVREDEVNSSNFILTDIMTETERFEMLNELLKYGETELEKVAQPQMTFTADVINLFGMPEFDRYSGYIELGNLITVYLRDDYIVKPRIIGIHYNFYDESDFSLTFSNILKKTSYFWSDVQEVLNEAHSVSTSVSFAKSYITEQAKKADTISQHLAEGLLSQGDYLKNGDDSELVMDSRGLFVTTTSGSYANRDSIYIGGGRILFTNDNWATVKMSVGRGIVKMPVPNSTGMNWSEQSKFGVFADFVVAGYVGSSTIVGGQIYSANYKTNSAVLTGNAGSHINLDDGTFEFNMSGSGNNQKKRLVLGTDGNLKLYGTIYAEAGKIGCSQNNPDNTGFTIMYDQSANVGRIYSGAKNKLNSDKDGIYLGTDGIQLGAYNASYIRPDGNKGSTPFSVFLDGSMTANSGRIGGFTLSSSSIYSGSSLQDTKNNAIGMSTANFQRNLKSYGVKDLVFAIGQNFGVAPDGTAYLSGQIYANGGKIAAFTIAETAIYTNDKKTIQTNVNSGIYIGNAGMSLGPVVDYGSIGGTYIGNKGKFEVDANGQLYANNGYFTGTISANRGLIGGFQIEDNFLRKEGRDSIADGAVTIGNADFGRSINNTYHGDLRIAVGKNFGVNKSGDTYCGHLEVKSDDSQGLVKLYNGQIFMYAKKSETGHDAFHIEFDSTHNMEFGPVRLTAQRGLEVRTDADWVDIADVGAHSDVIKAAVQFCGFEWD